MPLINSQTAQEYVFQEYPKWVKLPDGKDIIVQDNLEERAMLQGFYVPNKESEPEEEFVGFREEATATVATEEATPIEAEEPIIVPIIAPDGDVIAESIDSLRSQADRLGLIYDKRWGALKLRQAIDGARAQGALGALSAE